MLELVDPDLEWTYLDPALEHPTPQVCHGRQELEQVLRHWAEHGRRAELEEVTSNGELAMVGVRTPGACKRQPDAQRCASTGRWYDRHDFPPRLAGSADGRPRPWG
jgi:hypothetical protein